MSSVGQDRGVVLSYNKNITAIKVDENWDDVCTKLLPYVKDGDKTIMLDDVYVETIGLYDIPYTKVLEFKYEEKEGESAPNTTAKWKEWLRNEALQYLDANRLPKVNYTISAKLDNVSDVGDIIHVKHPKCKVDILTNVISVRYDAITGKYTSIEFGNFRKQIKNLVNEVASVTKVISNEYSSRVTQTESLISAEVKRATSAEDALSGRIDVEAGRVALLVDENGRVKGSVIVECINGQSAALISADKIQMTGTTTFLTPNDVGKNGKTVIDGGRIDTDTLYVAADNLGGQLVVGDMLIVTIPADGVAGSVKIGGFDVTKSGLSHDLINISTSGVGLGAAVEDMASEDVNHTTWISPYGKLISYQPIFYEMTVKGSTLFTGDSGNIVQFAIPIQASELTVNGVNFASLVSRVEALERGGGGDGGGNDDGGSTHTHSYTLDESTSTATCTSNGTGVSRCSCGATKTDVIPAYGHDWRYYDDTSVSSGTSRQCKRCGLIEEDV
jgi:hypothetical protein